MYCCLDCGHIFDDDEISIWQESRGEYWGVPCSETMSGCPRCHGNYVETYKCDCCGEYICSTYVELSNGNRYCDGCFQVKDIGD